MVSRRPYVAYASAFLAGVILSGVAMWWYERIKETRYTPAEQRLLRKLQRPPAASHHEQSPLVAAARKIRPTVVNVDTLEEVPSGSSLLPSLLPREGKASGVTISSDGYIVTNNHVVQGASLIRIVTAAGAKFEAHIVGVDATNDIALLRIAATGLPAAEFGDSDKLEVGEPVIAIGNPFGIGTTVTHGIISATDRRDLNAGEGVFLRRALQTDAAISRGNSGGALANADGDLIGINTAIVSERGANVGIGFAIPSNVVRTVLADILAHRTPAPPSPSEPYLGIVYAALTPEMSAQLELPPGQGVIILYVQPLTPAADAGLRRSDVILGIDGKPVRSVEDVRRTLASRKIGQSIRLRLLRGDGSEEVTVRLGRKPARVPSRT